MNMTPILRHDNGSHCDGYENCNWGCDLNWNHKGKERHADEGFAKSQGGTYECRNENRSNHTQCRRVNDQNNAPTGQRGIGLVYAIRCVRDAPGNRDQISICGFHQGQRCTAVAKAACNAAIDASKPQQCKNRAKRG